MTCSFFGPNPSQIIPLSVSIKADYRLPSGHQKISKAVTKYNAEIGLSPEKKKKRFQATLKQTERGVRGESLSEREIHRERERVTEREINTCKSGHIRHI